MKNERLIDSWNRAEPDHAARERMLGAILKRTRSKKTQTRKAAYMIKSFLPAAACAALALAVGLWALARSGGEERIPLSLSGGAVRASYYDYETPDNGLIYVGLRQITEYEIFHANPTDIFGGTVRSVRNIEIDMNGYKLYNAIAEISVDEVFRGGCASGDVVTVLLGRPLDAEDGSGRVAAGMAEGVKGIFMPLRYDESEFIERNGERLYWRDLAEYGFLDGERYLFLETPEGLLFYRQAYAGLENAADLTEVAQYIRAMLGLSDVQEAGGGQ